MRRSLLAAPAWPGSSRRVPTGAQINGHWVYDADLVVDGTRVPAYRLSDRIRVHRNDGTLHGGEIISVVRIAQDAPAVSVIAGPARDAAGRPRSEGCAAMVLSRIFALIVPFAAGALIGAIIGGIITGNDVFIIGWSIGGPFLIMLLIFLGVARSSVKKKTAGQRQNKPTGINETVTGAAGGSRGVVLNGEPLDGTDGVAIPSGMPQPQARPVRLRRGIAVVLVIAGAALSLIPAYSMIGWIASDVVHGQPFDGRDMRTGLHQNDAIAQIAEVVGSPDVTRVNFYDDYVIVTARTSPRSTTVDSYMWRYGGAFRSSPGSFEPDLADQLFDASKVDFSIIPSLITIAKRDSGLNDAEDYYPSVSRDNLSEGLGDPVIDISLSNDYFNAYYTFSLDGEMLEKSGSAFE